MWRFRGGRSISQVKGTSEAKVGQWWESIKGLNWPFCQNSPSHTDFISGHPCPWDRWWRGCEIIIMQMKYVEHLELSFSWLGPPDGHRAALPCIFCIQRQLLLKAFPPKCIVHHKAAAVLGAGLTVVNKAKKKKKSLGLWRLHSAILICNLDYKLIYNLQKRGILELTIPLVWEQLSMQSGRQVLYSQIRSKSAPPLSLSFLICQMKWLGETFKTLLALKFVDSTNQKSRRTLGTAGVCVWANLALYCFCSLFWQGAPGAFPDSSPL